MDFLALILFLIVVVGSMVVHEMAHGFVSYKLGDDTAKHLNRLSLNPLRHIDPFMSVILPMILLISGMPVFGGAKPVIVNRRKLKYGDVGMALVAAAGPLSNLILAILAGVVLVALRPLTGSLLNLLTITAINVNLGFFLFNMIPFPPLDGSRILYVLAPDLIQGWFDKIESLGLWPLFVFVLLGYSLISQYIQWGAGLFLSTLAAFF